MLYCRHCGARLKSEKEMGPKGHTEAFIIYVYPCEECMKEVLTVNEEEGED